LAARQADSVLASPVGSQRWPTHLFLFAQYEPAWLAGFVGERDRVTAVLKPWLAAPVEHIGSTSVPGLPAKPIVDMLALVKSLSQVQNAVAPLRADGWVFWPEDPCRPYRLWFVRPQDGRGHISVTHLPSPDSI
jgi:GrpB-like predicted nucleotidyltransferase (UPF0157 family)